MVKDPNRKENTSLVSRPPVVVVLGHVDSGKTSILDKIRQTHVVEKESGGITQHIGAYEVEFQSKKITFIDTPGHEAFSAMRSRGANVADIAVLVVDAVSGIQPQTKEAISLVKKAGIGLVVAIKKVDLPAVKVEKVKQDLLKEGIQVESCGGKVPSVEVSAKTGQGLDHLLELILLLAEMENLQADLSKPAWGVVVEACLDSLRGPLATVLLREGQFSVGQVVATATTPGKIRGLENFRGQNIAQALPSQPVVVLGLEQMPQVGDKIKVFASTEEAQAYVQKKERKKDDNQVVFVEEGKEVLNLILKADVSGSLEAIEDILASLPQDKVVLRVLEKSAGEVSESDIKLAQASRAVVLGFRVKESQAIANLRERLGVKVLSFDIIYSLVQAVRRLMESRLAPETERKTLGRLKVLAVFLNEKNRQIVGGKVIEGQAQKGAKIEVWRQDQSLGRGRLVSLQENKKDAFSVAKGREAGILYEGEAKVEAGDILEFFEESRQRAEL
jgi:translation initiation factor IF-2